MLSQKARYTIGALQHLADHYHDGPVQMAEIAKARNIPRNFLTVILSELAREGLITSQRGRDGGYRLGINPIDISYGDIIRIMRGSLALVPCASRNAYKPCDNCVDIDQCELRKIMLKVRDETAAILDATPLAHPFPVK